MNPLVNAGAITTTALVGGGSASAVWQNIADTYDGYAGRHLTVLEDVYKSEAETNQRNRAIAMLMYAYGHFKGDPLQATDIYTRQCSVGVTAKDLAMMAATLANGGTNPVTRKRMLDAQHVPQLLSVMATAGLYDDSGIWLFNTGLPAKSGVGGGLIAVSPGKWGVAVVSPPLDKAGNSVRAQRAIEYISSVLGGNPLAAGGEPMSASGRK
jgi:glutaminase